MCAYRKERPVYSPAAHTPPPVPRVRVADLAQRLGVSTEKVLAISRQNRIGVAAAESLLDPRECDVIAAALKPPKPKRPSPESPRRTVPPTRKPVRLPDLDAIWRRLLDAEARGETVSGDVIGSVRGGLVVNVDGVRAFLPRAEVGEPGALNLMSLVGQRISARITQIDRQGSRVVLSRRAVLEEELRGLIANLGLQPGEVRLTRVHSVTETELWVDLGGVAVLVPREELPASGNWLDEFDEIDEFDEFFDEHQELRVTICDVRGTEVTISLRTPPEGPGTPTASWLLSAMGAIGVRGLRIEDDELLLELSPENTNPEAQLQSALDAALVCGAERIHVLADAGARRKLRAAVSSGRIRYADPRRSSQTSRGLLLLVRSPTNGDEPV